MCELNAMTVEEIRLELGLKPTEFARRLGVSKGHAADLRSGRRKPSIRIAASLAKLAGRRSILNEAVREKAEG